ncbi:MAG TPA: hypothetical protein VEL28_09070, partial [Candidatus Binatia bacterium]|nr:hypothetical protein [Candidatus Binatia bacterium]
MSDRCRAHDETRHWYASFDPLLAPADADSMVELCHRFGSYKMYSEEPTFEGFGAGYPARYDAARNFIKTGGRFGRVEALAVLAARTNYFRESYAYGEDVVAPGVEPYLRYEGFIEAARALFGRPVIVPAIVYANLLVPGQELAVHTDVPEFRGINRQKNPQWLIVAMHHSGLFERYRMPIATGVAWYHDCAGGEFAFYPDGPDAPPVAYPVRFNTAVMMDTDSVFHGVDRVRETSEPVHRLRPGMRLVHEGDRRWAVRDGERKVTEYCWEDLRFSISWKAYCFADQGERRIWESHTDDLSSDTVLETMIADLRSRAIIGTDT